MIDELQLKLWDRQRALSLPIVDVCPHCCNEGWVTVSVPHQHPAFGRAFICICREQDVLSKESKRLKLKLGLPKKREHCTFEWFDSQPADMRRGKEDARRMAGLMASGEPMILDGIEKPHLCLVGDTGMGKSGLAACIGKARIAAGQSTMWIDYNEFNETVYTAQQRQFERDRKRSLSLEDNDGPDNFYEYVAAVSRVPFLIFDDLGDMSQQKMQLTDFMRDRLYTVIRTRYENELPCVITTNLSVKQLYEYFGPRIADRIGESWHWVRTDEFEEKDGSKAKAKSFRFGR